MLSATPEQIYQWRLSLEVKLRRLHGDALQVFFSSVMERIYQSDFVRVRPFGQLGDKGCDGYVFSTGQLYQCYGKVGDAGLNVALTTKKVRDDFKKADKNFGSLMKEWHFVNNLVDGVPSEVLLTIKELETKHSKYGFGISGLEWFWSKIYELPKSDVIEFLGPAATAEDSHGLNMEEVKQLISCLTTDIDEAPIDEGNPSKVPSGKLKFNKLANHWRHCVGNGSLNAIYVANYFERHINPELGKIVAKLFRDKYQVLKLEGLAPNAIMAELYLQTAGNGIVMPDRQVAVQAILAYLFDSCDIFEEPPMLAGAA
jgi:hypothetical protein